MTEEQMNIYKMRITQAGIGDFAVILLELEAQWIEEALAAYAVSDMDEFIDCVEKAQAVQLELMKIMNLDNEVAVDVYSVFVYFNKQLITAKIKRQPLDLARCCIMLEKYRDSFAQVAKTDKEGPIMAGSEKVYAGFTYGAGGLVESSVGGMEFSV